MNNEPKKTIDERLEALTMNLELLSREMEASHLRQEAAERRERRGRQAILTGIAAYLRALEDGDTTA